MGNPDLSASRSREPERPRGLVIFPSEANVRLEPDGRGGEWWPIVAALLFAAIVIGAALLLR